MPKPGPKDKNQKQSIAGKPLKDIIPSSYPHIRDPKEVEYPPQGEKIYSPENAPIELFPEWPSNETDLESLLKPLTPENEDQENIEKFIDSNNSKVLLPLSLFTDYLNMNIKWSSPEKYITEIYLDKLIQKQMPKKNSFKFRMKVHEFYEEELKIRQRKLQETNEENEINENKNEESEADIDNKDEFLIYRDFFKILDNPLNIQVVNFIKRMETEEEMNERLKKLGEEYQHVMQNEKNKKGKNRNSKNFQNEIMQEKIEITIPSPNNINLNEGTPPYFRWLGSIYQIIKDRNLLDVKTGENIWAKIYPQKNGIPQYNKNGHYIIKLHHMGKMRAVEIDDRMPISTGDEFFFPRCESLEELWPALLTKALLKLYSYKIISSKFCEIGDPEPFYALTGYVPTLLKEIKFNVNNNKFKIGRNKEQSKIEEIDSKKDESSNNKDIKDIKENKDKVDENVINNNNEDNNKNEEKLNDSLEKENINNENKNEKNNQEMEIDNNINLKELQDKLNFLENALTDQNYSEFNYLIECFHTIDTNYYKMQTDLKNLDEEDEEEIINQMHINDNKEEKNDENKENQKTEEEIHEETADIKVIDNNIENNNININNEKKRTDFLNSIKSKATFTSDVSMTDQGKPRFKHLYDKLEDFSMEYNLYKGILYDIIDIFNNKEYNMDRLKPIDFSDLKAMLKNFNKNNVFKQLNKEEKKEYITNLKKIKEKQKMLKAQRIENLKLKGEQYYAIKIQNNGITKTNYNSKYSDNEIQMTKKCLLNKWEFPPIEYLDEKYEEKKKIEKEKQEKEELENEEKKKKRKKSPEKKLSKIHDLMADKEKMKELEIMKEKEKIKDDINNNLDEKKEKRTWSKEIYMQLIDNNTEQFKESLSLIQRNDGYWIESAPFFSIFNNFLVLYNPSKYNTVFDWDNYWYETDDILTPKDENSILYLKKINIMNKSEVSNEKNKNEKKDKNETQNEEIFIKNKNPCNYIVIMYEAISDKNNKLRNLPFKINFRFIKKDERIETGKVIRINSFYGSERIEGLEEDSEYFLILENGIFPEGFFVKVISDFSISPLSWQNFLSNHLNYNKQSFHVEYNALQKNEIYVLLRVSIINETRSKFMIISNNIKDKYSNEFIKLYICDTDNRNTKKVVEFKTFFELNPGKYMLVMTINPSYVLEANSYEVDILSYSEFNNSMMMDMSQTNTAVPGEQNKPLGITMEKVETVAPYEIMDSYHFNKNNILFKEFIFAGNKISAFLHIKIVKLLGNNDSEINERSPRNNNIKNNDENEEKPYSDLKDLVRLKLELFNKENELILTQDFYNEITLSNLTLEGNIVQENNAKAAKKLDKKTLADIGTTPPPSNLPYSLICTIDTTEAPRHILEPDFLKNLGWNIRVFSTDTLGFCQDTSKEDKEKEIIASWEEKEPGRAELAKKSRKRFLLQKKAENGKKLTEEEANFLKEERVRKSFYKKEEEEKDDDKNKGKKKQEKVDKNKKKGKENDKNEEEKEKENFGNLNLDINYDKKISTVKNHSSLFIKNFLSYAYDNRMLTFNSNYEQEEKELNNEILTTEKEEKINAEYLESEKQNVEKMNLETKKKEEFKINNKKMIDKMMNQRKKEVEECKSFYQTRTSLAMNIQNKIIIEKKCANILNSLLHNEQLDEDQKNKKKKPGESSSDLEEAVSAYNEAAQIGLKSDVIDKLFNEISVKKEEEYKNEINKPADAKNKNRDLKTVATKILEEINSSKWKISKGFIEELNKIKST